jgi:hypothetical protein
MPPQPALDAGIALRSAILKAQLIRAEGLEGTVARAVALAPKKRSQIAAKAAKARWETT